MTVELLNDPRWEAVLARDAAQDGRFVLAVRTTRIYCRPSCPARRPRRENVTFFVTPAEARAAGYRACRRCHPDDPDGNPTLRLVRRATALLDDGEAAPRTLAELAAELRVSPYHLQRTFKRVTGVSPRQYAGEQRTRALRTELRNGRSVTDAIYDAGYGSASRAYEDAARMLGMTPGAYRNGASGTQLRYTIVDSELGRLLVAATPRGISRVALGDTDADLELLVRTEFPSANVTRDDDALRSLATRVARLAAGQAPSAQLPLDVRATAFQRQVWQALERIPAGSTRSYAQVAADIGRPGAARAVASACAANPVALVVPCHRVVRGNGDLGGYRWGTQRKARLLAVESAARS